MRGRDQLKTLLTSKRKKNELRRGARSRDQYDHLVESLEKTEVKALWEVAKGGGGA